MTTTTSTTRRGLVGVVRAPVWWSTKLLPLLGAAGLASLAAGTPARPGLERTVAMLVSAICVAAGAHVVNDLADRAADATAGKPNLLSTAARPVGVALLVLSAIGGTAPWFVVDLDPAAGAVLGGLVVLSIAYSCPPTRLKGRGGVSVVSDALVAHTLPTAFAFLELGSAGHQGARWWTTFVAALVWSFGFGARNIIVHQLLDADGDRAAGVSTFVVRRGVPHAVRTGRDAVGVELVGLAVLAGATAASSWGVALFFGVHVALWCYHRRFDRQPIDTVPTTAGAWLPFAEFYQVWPVVSFGIALALRDPGWWWFLVGLVVLFPGAVGKQIADEVRSAADVLIDAAHVVAARARAVYHFVLAVIVKRIVYWGILVPTGHWIVRTAKAAVARAKVIGWAVYRGFWAVNRFVWRGRHAVADPTVAFVRRQWRRARRRVFHSSSTR